MSFTKPHCLNSFHSQLLDLKKTLDTDLNNLQKQEEELNRENSIDINHIKSIVPKFINLTIMNKTFMTSTENIFKFSSSVFFYILAKQTRESLEMSNNTLYFERPNMHFHHILNYLKHSYADLSELNKGQLEELEIEANYYNLQSMVRFIKDIYPVEVVGYIANDPYFSGFNLIGEINVDAIKKNDNRGITVMSPAWITLELNKVTEFNTIRIKGYSGNTLFSPSNGSSSNVSVSLDGIVFRKIGVIGNINNILTSHIVEKSTGKYIKLENSSYIGISYIEVDLVV